MLFRKKMDAHAKDSPACKPGFVRTQAFVTGNKQSTHVKERPLTKKADKMIGIVILWLIAAVIAVAIMFRGVISNYRSSTAQESTAHLTEINQELQLYVEAKIEAYWNASHSIVNSISNANIATDEAMLSYLLRERAIYGVSNITLYTQSGYAVNTDGSVLSNDDASQTVATIKKAGEYLAIRQSTIIYVVPIDTETRYGGSRIVAVSVVQDLSSFLDNMGISSFAGQGFVYLTQNNGAVISKQTHDGTYSVYNLLPLFENSVIRPLSDNVNSVDDMLTSDSCSVFLRETTEGNQYIVCSPIQTGCEQMRLFYFVPVSVVNQTTDSFSSYISALSIIAIVVFAIGAVLIFLYLYNARKKQFGKELSIRENMLELLVQNSKSAFALLSVEQTQPRFYSGNGVKILGEAFYSLEKADSGYRMRGSSGAETDEIKELNAQMRNWDGKCEFRSSFIRNNTSVPPVYFEIQLFPSEKTGEYVAIAQDVTPLYERQAAVTEALAMAEQANQAKTRFLSSMSHDIRTPMNAIVNMTNFAMESIGEPERQRGYLDSLRKSSLHLLELINDVLDMSRIESGRMTIAGEPFDLRAELDRICDIVRLLCAEKGQRFAVDFSGVRSFIVLGDQVKLSQILMNLLSNACKFTPAKGSICFLAECLPSLRENVANIRFRVEDTGIGMSQDDIKNIFEPFARADNEQVSRIEGTGLGLSICRSYINAMGGTIDCESELGRGSVFTVELFFPLTKAKPVKHADTDVAGDNSFAGRRCLICEDNQINRTIAQKLLQRLGFAIELAVDGKEGVEKFTKSIPGYYDVIYMDVRMPVMDGYHATAAIRNSVHPQSKSIPIIAMTANVFAEDVERARAAGMNGHLGKPILVTDLIETTNAVLNNKGEFHEKGI